MDPSGSEENGTSSPPNVMGADGAVTTFSESHFEVRKVQGAFLLKGSFELFPMPSPKGVDWIDATGPDAGKHSLQPTRWNAIALCFVAADEGIPPDPDFEV